MTETYRYKGDYGLMVHIRRDTVEEIEAVAARLFAALPEEVNQFHVERRIARVRRPRGAAVQLPSSPFPRAMTAGPGGHAPRSPGPTIQETVMDEPKHPAPVDLAVERERTSARLTVFEHGLYVRAEIALEMGSPDEWLFDAMAHISARQCLPGSREAGFAVVSSEALFIVGGKIEELLVGGKPWPWPEEDDG